MPCAMPARAICGCIAGATAAMIVIDARDDGRGADSR